MKLLCLALLLFLFAASANALPVSPGNIGIDGEENGIKISWEYQAEGFSFNVHRGNGFEDSGIIASVKETFFIDKNLETNREYFYFVTAVNSAGEESLPSNGYSVKWQGTKKPKQPVAGGEEFNVIVVEPQISPGGQTLDFGETMNIVLRVNSTRFSELTDLNAILVNEALGLRKEFVFDAAGKTFSLAIKLPEEKEIKSLPATYIIWASAFIGEQQFLDSKEIRVFFVPSKVVNIEPLVIDFAWIFIPLALGSAVILVSFRTYTRKKAEKERIKLEFLEVAKERAVWKYDMFQSRVSQQQYLEKERELQGKQLAIEKRLGIGGKGITVRRNPFEGYKPDEIDEITGLVGFLAKNGKKMGKEGLMQWLIRNGKNERISKKVVELVFNN